MARSFLLLSLALLFLVFSGCEKRESSPQLKAHRVTQEEIGKESVCPVCGMKISVSSQTPAVNYEGKIYYFCTEQEVNQFRKDPSKYNSSEKKEEKTTFEPEEVIAISKEALEASGYEIHKITNQEIDKIVLCPGCRMYLAVSSTTPALKKDGEIFYFCSGTCMDTFLRRKK